MPCDKIKEGPNQEPGRVGLVQKKKDLMRTFAFLSVLLLFSACQGQDFNQETPFIYSDLTGFWEVKGAIGTNWVEYSKKSLVTKRQMRNWEIVGIKLLPNGQGSTNLSWNIRCFTVYEPEVFDLNWDWERTTNNNLLLHLQIDHSEDYSEQKSFIIQDVTKETLILEPLL